MSNTGRQTLSLGSRATKVSQQAQRSLGSSKRDAGDESTNLSTITTLCQETNHTTASLNDLYDLLLNEQRSRSSDHVEVKSRLDRIEARLTDIESHLSLVVSAVAISPVLRANTIRDVNIGKYTRNVMTTIPAVLLMIIWRDVNKQHAFPTTQNYLEKLFKGLGDDKETNLRSELGILFSTVIDQGTSVTLGTMSALLSDNSSSRSIIMREHCVSLYKSIATDYAFMIPQTLAAFVLKIRGITVGGDIEYDHYSKEKKGPVICPGEAYEMMGPDWLAKPPVMKYLHSQRSRKGNKFLRGLCTSLKSGKVPTEDETRSLGFQHDGSFDDILSPTPVATAKISNDRTSLNTPRKKQGKNSSKAVDGSMASSLFSPRKV